jgi:hypothetical protein
LKGIRVSDIQINNCIFADQRSGTFWTDLVHTIKIIINLGLYGVFKAVWKSFPFSQDKTLHHWLDKQYQTFREKVLLIVSNIQSTEKNSFRNSGSWRWRQNVPSNRRKPVPSDAPSSCGRTMSSTVSSSWYWCAVPLKTHDGMVV